MKITQKQKIEGYDALVVRVQLLELALHDSFTDTKFPFLHRVFVDCARELDRSYPEVKYYVSVSTRAMPYYKVEQMDRGKVRVVTFVTDSELSDHREDTGIYWRMLRYAVWMIGVLVRDAK